jgi:hypothetical protein
MGFSLVTLKAVRVRWCPEHETGGRNSGSPDTR